MTWLVNGTGAMHVLLFSLYFIRKSIAYHVRLELCVQIPVLGN